MFTQLKTTSLVSAPNIRVSTQGASALAQALDKSRTSNRYKARIRTLFLKLDKQVEQEIVRITGGQVFNKPSITNPTYTTTLDIRRDKENDITIRNDSTITQINLVSDINKVVTGTPKDETIYNKQLLDDIKRLQQNPSALFSLLLNNKTTERLVSNYNSISLLLSYSGKRVPKSIRFSTADIVRGLKSGKVILSVEHKGVITTISIRLNVDILVSAINSANALIVRQLSGSLGRSIAQIIAEETALPSRAVMRDIKTFLESLGLSYALRYVQGAELNRTQIIERTIGDKQVGYQSFISAIQWTALVQARLGQTMERLGEPDAPDLKERTGRFRSSVAVSPDYKRDRIRYTYMPLYTSLERYGYRPDIQVERAITEVAQQQFGRAFRIIEKI